MFVNKLKFIRGILLSVLLCLIFLGFQSRPVLADDSMPQLQIPIPDLHFSAPSCSGEGQGKVCSYSWISEYIAAIYKYAIGVIGIIGTITLMIGGVIWLTAGGNQTKVASAQEWIKASITGIVIALSSYMILYQVNPDLVKLKPLTIGEIQRIPPELLNYMGSTGGDGSMTAGTTYDANTWDAQIKQIANEYGVDPALVKAIMATESSGNPNAVSPVGAEGLMQLMPATAQAYGVANPFDPGQNLTAGTQFIDGLLSKYGGNVDYALAAYNWGPGNLDRKGYNNMPSETINYINRVNAYYNKFKGTI